MAIALAQSNLVFTTSNTATTSATYTSTTTTGNFMLAIIRQSAVSVTGVTDNKSNTWTLLGSSVNYTSSKTIYYYYCANAAGGATHTVNAACSGTGWSNDIQLVELSGAATSSPINVTLTGPTAITSNASGASPTNGTPITTTVAGAYAIGTFDATTNTTYSAASGWTMLGTVTNNTTIGHVGAVAGTAGSITPQILSAITAWPEKSFAFAVNPAASAVVPHNLTLLGIGL